MQRHPQDRSLIKLSPREAQLVRLICTEPLTHKEIATRLNLGITTVSGMVRDLVAELGIYGRSGLMIWGWQHPAALKGEWDDVFIHKPGCSCRFCSIVEMEIAA